MSEKTDEEIAKLVQKGNTESFGVLVERYEQKLLRYAKKFLFNWAEAEDLTQEVFIKTYTNIKSFNPKLRFSPWIYRIAHNEFLNALRKKTKTPSFFSIDLIFPHPFSSKLPDKELEKKEIKDMIGKCMEKLDLKYREPLALYYLEDMDYKEISKIMRIPVATVGVRLRRGKEKLSKVFKEVNF